MSPLPPLLSYFHECLPSHPLPPFLPIHSLPIISLPSPPFLFLHFLSPPVIFLFCPLCHIPLLSLVPLGLLEAQDESVDLRKQFKLLGQQVTQLREEIEVKDQVCLITMCLFSLRCSSVQFSIAFFGQYTTFTLLYLQTLPDML